VAPNLPGYSNRGQALPGGKSQQVELGLKVGTANANWGLALFQIERPAWSDICNSTQDSCTRTEDGDARHRGAEANAAWRAGAWSFQGGLQALQARRRDSAKPQINGKRPTNVPDRTLKLQTRYQVATVPGLSVQADALGVSDRMVLEDNSARIPGYAQFDLSTRYEQKLAGSTLTWRAGVDNLFDRRAWRESPFQFSHVYLYPLAARTFRLSVEASL
jgi:iron complex outermembrane receptor protein